MKKHWTQTTAGRKRIAELTRERHAAKRKAITHVPKEEAPLTLHTTYLFGRVETIIELYAAGIGLPKAALARGVGELLQHQASGAVLGA